MALINCEINPMLTWSRKCVIASTTTANQETKFAMADTKLYVPVVTLSTQDNAKLLQHLKSVQFKRTINWNYQSKIWTQAVNPYLDFLIDPSFHGVNRLFALSFQNVGDRVLKTKYFLPTEEMKDFNVMTDGNVFFHQSEK